MGCNGPIPGEGRLVLSDGACTVVVQTAAGRLAVSVDRVSVGGVNKIVGAATMKDRIHFSFGAEFVEVRSHARTREVRVPRVVGAFAAERIPIPRTARSQLMGALIRGVSSAPHEATEIDPRNGRYTNDNLADYLIPVSPDINRLDVIFVPEKDDKVNPPGVKGLGEPGNVRTNAAVDNAVFYATGKRIRELPIRIENLMIRRRDGHGLGRRSGKRAVRLRPPRLSA